MGTAEIYRFLLAKFHFEAIQGELTVNAVRNTLKSLPQGLDATTQTYVDVMARIEQQDADSRTLARYVLTWIVLGHRPLKVLELLRALAMMANPGLQTITDDDLTEESRVLSVCAGLIVVDSVSQTVRLIHYTAQQYFDDNREKWFENASLSLSRTCVKYLLISKPDLLMLRRGLGSFLSSERERMISEDPFLGYAARYWGHHVADVQTDIEM